MALNILIADDSLLTRKAIRRIIDMIGLDVEQTLEAENGSEAIALLETHRVDLVIADLNMPVMDGTEMIGRMRNNEAMRHIPVVVVSTESSATRIEGLLAQGVQDYLHKPFRPEEFRNLIDRTIGVDR
jgi:two-component system chemotaxis response regulator CheY